MPDATFSGPDLTSFAGLADLGLEVTGRLVEADRAVCSRAWWSNLMTGAEGTAARASRGTQWFAGWGTNRSGSDLPRCWSRSVDSVYPGADTP